MKNFIKSKTIIGMLWNFFEKASTQIVSFVIGIILARLLSPDDYGIIAMLTIFIALSQIFIDSGFSNALIQRQDRTETDFSTVFFFNFVISIVIYVILFLFAPLIAHFYRTPILLQLTRVLFLIIIFNSFTVVQNARLMIAVDFKKIALVNFVSVVISGVIGIISAYNNYGVWSLVIQSLVRSIVSMVLFWIVGCWRPTQKISFQSFKRLFSFGSKLLLAGTLATIFNNIYSIVIGKIYQSKQLGFYTRAQQFAQLPSGLIASVLQTSTFPLLTSLQNDRSKLLEVYKRLLRITAIFVFPIMTGIALLSKHIIIVLLTDKWLPSADLLFWAALTYLFYPLSALNLNLANAIGSSGLFLKLDMSKMPMILIAMIITFPISIKAIVIGNFITAFISYLINAYVPKCIFSYGVLKQTFDEKNIIISTFIMAVFLIIFVRMIRSNILVLVFGIPLGMFVYGISLFLLKEEEMCNIITKFNKKDRV
ncbi:lipopolysaccharide biosynthesis protein [Treponema primitia]|uniref:lipopolysaccharide biosynthesis protein n=1 Tax=Treponema primitia TaxID=88058 RepID=UPI0002554ECA|nr:lipopolysaccharide biosynthesis protein [Treponema primitia]